MSGGSAGCGGESGAARGGGRWSGTRHGAGTCHLRLRRDPSRVCWAQCHRKGLSALLDRPRGVGMLRTCVNVEFALDLTAEFVLGQHADDRLLDDAVGVLLHQVTDAAFVQAAGIPGVAVSHLALQLVAADGDLVGVDDDDEVSAIDIGRERRLVLTAQQCCCCNGEAAKHNMTLLLENESECNTATGEEAAATLAAVISPNFQLNWDPGNAAAHGEIAFPDGFRKIPTERIGHMHCKDVVRKADGTYEWAAMGRGIIDYVGQFRALVQAGYRGTMSLETHWNGAGSPEESSRQSMAGMKAQLGKAGAL